MNSNQSRSPRLALTDIQFNQWSLWQQQVFATALLQRMLPNYAYFSEATGFGDYKLVQNQIDIIWQKLQLLPVKFKPELQLEKLYPCLPDVEKFDVFAVYPALDVCSGLVALFESFDDKLSECAQDLSLLSLSGVERYLNFAQESEIEAPENNANDPLMLWELQTQSELFKLIDKAKPAKAVCLQAKQLVTEQRLTNLAIEY
jgi:uncharacterized protein